MQEESKPKGLIEVCRQIMLPFRSVAILLALLFAYFVTMILALVLPPRKWRRPLRQYANVYSELLGTRFRYFREGGNLDEEFFTVFLPSRIHGDDERNPASFQARARSYVYRVKRNIARKNYQTVLQRIRKKEKPIEVLLVSSGSAKWCVQSLYDALENDPRFNVKVVTILRKTHGINYQKTYDFFEQRGMNVVHGYDRNHNGILDLSIFSPDIVFLPEPWLGDIKYAPLHISQYALACYVPYSFMLFRGIDRQYRRPFHNELWKYFCPTPIHLQMAQKAAEDKGENVVVTGYPKMDFFLKKPNDKDTHPSVAPSGGQRKKRIIWAPHWTVTGNIGGNDVGTFMTYAEVFYLYCKETPEIDFILKPHPNLWHSVVKEKLLSAEELESWLACWNALPNATVMDEGNYFDLFAGSDAMILDSGSFIAEYTYTQKPMLYLCKYKDTLAETTFNDFGKKAIKHLYQAHCWEDVVRFIDDVVVQGNDPLCEQRIRFVNDVLKWTDKPACELIIDYLASQLQLDSTC
jgi:hypothetical protein